MGFARFVYKRLMVHLMVWGIILLLPFLISSYFGQTFAAKLNAVPILIAMFLFYINYLYFIPRYFFTKKTGMFIWWNIGVISLITVALMLVFYGSEELIMEGIRKLLSQREGIPLDDVVLPSEAPPPEVILYKSVITQILAVGAALGTRVSIRWRSDEARRVLLEKEQLRIEVEYLKYQLQPHFFFNTLNNIYSLIDSDANKAKETVHGLGKLMRYVLYRSNEPLVPITAELDFIKAYSDVMRIRYDQNVQVNMNFEGVDENFTIPPLILVSLVENAFKHGIDPKLPSLITIKVNTTSEYVQLQTINPLFEKLKPATSDSGVGLANLKKRLALIYGDSRYNLETEIQNGNFVAQLNIFA